MTRPVSAVSYVSYIPPRARADGETMRVPPAITSITIVSHRENAGNPLARDPLQETSETAETLPSREVPGGVLGPCATAGAGHARAWRLPIGPDNAPLGDVAGIAPRTPGALVGPQNRLNQGM